MKRTRYFIITISCTVCLLAGCGDDGLRYTHILEVAQQQNVNYDSITHIDSIEDAVKYFDSHGSANERVRAHYLLGCAYRDAGEAPKALECYHDAVDCADTTKADCDYNLLVRLHAQMADLFYKQLLPYDMLTELEALYKCALHAEDTLNAIISIERKAGVYNLLNKPDSIIIIRQHASQLYKSNGHIKEAALALGPLIDRYVDKGELVEARKCIDFYEKESGAVKDGEIISSKATFYYSKGRYYLAKGDTDSVQFLFRKLLSPERTDNQKEAGYRGLYLLYKQIGNKDSLAKYADLCYQLNSKTYTKSASRELQNMQSLYNFSRSQRLASQMSDKAHRNLVIALLVTGVAILSIIIICAIWTCLYLYKGKKYELLLNEYANIKNNLRRTYSDLEKVSGKKSEIEKAYLLLKEEKEQDGEILTEQLKEYENMFHSRKEKDIKDDIHNSFIYIHIQSILKNHKAKMIRKDWADLDKMIDKVIPLLYNAITKNCPKISEDDYRICLLTRIYLSPSEISALTDIKLPTLTMRRIRLLKDIFNVTGKAEDFDKRILKIC